MREVTPFYECNDDFITAYNPIRSNNNATLFGLYRVKALDMSGSHLASMDQHSLDAQSKTLNKLALSGNLLTALPATLLSQLHALKEVDLSSNPWLCDTNIKSGSFPCEFVTFDKNY